MRVSEREPLVEVVEKKPVVLRSNTAEFREDGPSPRARSLIRNRSRAIKRTLLIMMLASFLTVASPVLGFSARFPRRFAFLDCPRYPWVGV